MGALLRAGGGIVDPETAFSTCRTGALVESHSTSARPASVAGAGILFSGMAVRHGGSSPRQAPCSCACSAACVLC